jgi:hypothetical protein
MREKHCTGTDFQMIKITIVLVTLSILICSLSNTLSACQYNIRETGFVDFGMEQYHFYGFVNHETAAEIVVNFERACSSIFKNCNIVPEIINVEAQQDHSALGYISQNNIHTFPSAVLVSPDSQVFVIPIPISKQLSENDIKIVLENIVHSPLRNTIIDQVIKTYGVILIIEGAAHPENERIRKIGKQAIDAIESQMKLMPKSIEHPPELIVLNRIAFQKEELLLWSLGLESQNIRDTYAAVIYGKVRWIGPLLKGGEINEKSLANILSIVGQDCECGLDMRVMQGTRLPVKWDEKTQSRLVKHLGFDPENPVIKLEMNRIIRKGLASSPGAPIYYQSQVTRKNNQDDPLYVVDYKWYLKKPLYYLGILSLMVIIVGLLFILNKRRRRSI